MGHAQGRERNCVRRGGAGLGVWEKGRGLGQGWGLSRRGPEEAGASFVPFIQNKFLWWLSCSQFLCLVFI